MTDLDSSSSSFQSSNSSRPPSLTRRESSSDRADDAALVEEQFPTLVRRGSLRFDITAGGTTARLHSSLVGHSGGHAAAHIFDDENNNGGDDPLINESKTKLNTKEFQNECDEFDPEKTPLLGNGPPTRTLQRMQEQYGPSTPPPQLDQSKRRRSGAGVLESVHQKVTENNAFQRAAGQVPAIALIGLFHLMIGIPFGVSYFPVGWRAMGTTAEKSHDMNGDSSDVNGPFPLPAKEAVGIRMFLFSTAIGQIVFTLQSQFRNPIGLQMVENVPFCQALATIVIRHQGYGIDALSTILIIFAISSVVVGSVFWVLGRYRLGRVIYFFPTVRPTSRGFYP